MNIRHLLLITLCLLASYVIFAQDVQPPPDVERLYDALRARAKRFEVPPDTPIDVLLFDINHDGIPDALASLREDQQGGGCHGNDWYLYQFKDGKWQPGTYRKIKGGFLDPNFVYARGDDFFSLTEEGQKPKLIHIYSRMGRLHGNPTYDYDLYHDAWEITIDDEGYLKTIPIPELTTNYFGISNMDKNIIETDWEPPEIYKELSKKLVRLPIVTLPPQQDGDKDPPPVVTAEAGVQGGEKTSSSQGKVTKLNGVVAEQEKSENESNPNRLWLYAGILLLVCVGFYVLRRKLKTGN